MDRAVPNIRGEFGSEVEIIYDTDEFNLYKIYKKYEELSEKLDERLKHIRQKRGHKK